MKLTLLLIIIIFTSCATEVKVYTPSSRYLTAEANGKALRGHILGGITNGTELVYNLENNETDNPAELNNNVTPNRFAVDLGIVERLDFYSYFSLKSPLVYGLKYQLYGSNRQDANVGNNAIAFTFGGGTMSKKVNSADLFNINDIDGYKLDHNILEASLIFSRRVEKDTVVYFSLDTSKHDVDVKLSSDDEPELDDEKIELDSQNTGATLGIVRYFDTFVVAIESSLQQTNWTYNDAQSFGFIGANIGSSF